MKILNKELHINIDCMFRLIAVPPKIQIDEKFKDIIILPVNKSTILEIMFAASPQPKVTWSFNNGKLPDPSRTKDETIYGMTALTISRAKRSDSGTYTLKIENNLGSATFDVRLKVIGL